MNSDDTNDPWGNPYVLDCDPSTGAAAVWNADPDEDEAPAVAAARR
jgi:hypothetical protein